MRDMRAISYQEDTTQAELSGEQPSFIVTRKQISQHLCCCEHERDVIPDRDLRSSRGPYLSLPEIRVSFLQSCVPHLDVVRCARFLIDSRRAFSLVRVIPWEKREIVEGTRRAGSGGGQASADRTFVNLRMDIV